MPRREKAIMICANAESAWATPGTTYTMCCHFCFQHVMVAPSGQQFLREHPAGVDLMCFRCYLKDHLYLGMPALAADVETVAREIRSAVPNLYRERN